MAGEKEINVMLPAGFNVMDLLNWLSEAYGEEFKSFILDTNNDLWSHFSIAVNDELIDRSGLGIKLTSGDTVKFLFPVVGG